MATSRLRPATRRLVLAEGVNSLGTGLVLPVLLIYLHRVRDIPLPTTGLLLMAPAVVGLALVPLSGVLLDRLGPRRVLAGALLTLGVSQLGLAWAHDAATALPALLLQGVGLSPTFPAFNTLIARLETGAAGQQRAFAVNFTVINAAIGLGGLVSAAVVDVARPGSFEVLFVGNAVASALGVAVLRTVAPPPAGAHQVQRQRGGYRVVLADRALRRLFALSLLLAMTGYAALDSGLPAYANVVAGVPARVVALALSANTLTIVVVQLPVLRLLRTRRRTRALAVVGGLWTLSWALFATAPMPGAPWQRYAVVVAFAALFGVGETFLSPSAGPLTNALASDALRGRVNALASGMYSVAFVVSPAISAGFISSGLSAAWLALLCAGGVGVAVVSVRLGRLLPAGADSVGASLADAGAPAELPAGAPA